MLPLDVDNQDGGGFPMSILWIIVYVLTGALAIVVIPFTIFYYEAEDPTEEYVARKEFVEKIILFMQFVELFLDVLRLRSRNNSTNCINKITMQF
jgi:hypothetical protein